MVAGALKNVFGFITEIFKFLGWVIGLFKPIPTWIVNLLIAVAVALSVSPLLLSLQGVRKLEPLLVPLGMFYLGVFIVRLLLWPKQMPNNPLPDISKSSQSFIERLLFYGIPVLIFFWLLVYFGVVDRLGDTFSEWYQYFAGFEIFGQLGGSSSITETASDYYNRLLNIQGLSIPNTDYVIPGGVVLILGALAFILLIRRLVRR